MNKVLEFFKGLSPTQWAMGAIAALLGSLVAALRLQGSRLHKAQVQLLDTKLTANSRKLEDQTLRDLTAYQDALNSFKKAGGTLGLLLALLLPSPSRGEAYTALLAPNSPIVRQCEDTLSLCDKVVTDEANQIKDLQNQVVEWKKVAYPDTTLPLLLTGAASGGLGGGLAGATGGNTITGALIGLLMGSIVGLVVGGLQ